MDHPFENLGPEKFQEFCQSLIVAEYPDIQCFPVAQPDGGRDAWELPPWVVKDAIVFQIKYARKPLAEQDPQAWIKAIAQGEAEKVKYLRGRGVQRYILVTNIPGTAHPHSGSIDTVNKILSDTLAIPAICWWRDDLNRRFDNNWNLKWSYPDLMTGPDLIRAIIESGLTEHKERRSNAIKTFVRAQYIQDKEVKFKQVELQNKLLDLFVDVPIEYSHSFTGDRRKRDHREMQLRHLPARISRFQNTENRTQTGSPQSVPLGAASLLLNAEACKVAPLIVLEGAPGQGKSTITQYLCQVHRMRILAEASDLNEIPIEHWASPIRLPFKTDLRDLGTWLLRKDPFNPDNEGAPDAWEKSLESFLAAQVRFYSGGADFSVSDLHAVSKLSAVLLVFDGLDEIADIKRRREIVDELKRGVLRLKDVSASIQAIVTSRPAAFANSPGLPDDIFPYFSLKSLSKELVNEYAERWLKARKIHSREAADVKSILKEKIDQPHLRELARNPMQLAILLSLIHSRGTSLPDKRTALYDAYMELFFSRESTKSEIVRDNRELLLDIHRYLAWTLHSEAEQGKERDKISEDRLKKILLEYLRSEGHNESVFDELFSGMIERVVAIVSRVQGTYEFEVQPLREYFAARHLYVTSPYSPAGNECRGTMPDRFDAIARNFYWLNVTRFFAGCLDKGELPALIDRLQVLGSENGYKYTNYPRSLAATLLADWVFTQQPRHLKQVIDLVLDDTGMRYVLASSGQSGSTSHFLTLPDKCGRLELIDKCFKLLASKPLQSDYSSAICNLITENATKNEMLLRWITRMQSQQGKSRSEWLKIGRDIGCLSQTDISLDILTNLVSDAPVDGERLGTLLSARRLDYLESNEQRFSETTAAILDGLILSGHQPKHDFILDLLGVGLDIHRYILAFKQKDNFPMKAIWIRSSDRGDFNFFDPIRGPSFGAAQLVNDFLDVIRACLEAPIQEWAISLVHWDSLVEKGRSLWGEKLQLIRFAIAAAGIKSPRETGEGHTDLFDSNSSLCKRVRYARLKSGAKSWWRNQLTKAKTTADKTLAILILLVWGSGRTILALAPLIELTLKSIGTRSDLVLKSIRLFDLDDLVIKISFDFSDLPEKMDPLLAAALYSRCKQPQRAQIYERFLAEYTGNNFWILRCIQEQAIHRVKGSAQLSSSDLDNIARAYSVGVTGNRYSFQHLTRTNLDWMSLEIAEEIAQNPAKYPKHLLSIVEKKFRQLISSQTVPVGDIAQKDKWFAETS